MKRRGGIHIVAKPRIYRRNRPNPEGPGDGDNEEGVVVIGRGRGGEGGGGKERTKHNIPTPPAEAIDSTGRAN